MEETVDRQEVESALQKSSIGPLLRRALGPVSTVPSAKDRTPKIHLIANPQQEEDSIDIVAIHGEKGDWKDSWTSPDTGFFWLADILPSVVPSARILSCSHNGIQDNIGESLLWDLIDDRAVNGRLKIPIVILAHSLGGTLAKELFIRSSPSRNSSQEAYQLHSCINGFMFFGAIQQGGAAKEVQALVDFVRWIPGLSTQQQALSAFLKHIPITNDEFKLLGGEQVPTVCFYETKPLVLGSWQKITVVSQEKGTLDGAENRAIEADHPNLARFTSPTDGQLQRVLGSMRRLVSKASAWPGIKISISKLPAEPSPGLRVLSLDGGGVRGLFSIIVLEKLMELVRLIDTPNSADALKPCNYFDLIGGTSTGGLLAIMLGRLRMDVRACKQAYRDMSRQIFQKTVWSLPGKKWWDAYWDKPWFSGERLETAVKTIIVKELSLAEKTRLQAAGTRLEDALLLNEHETNSRCFVCACVKGQFECERLRSYVPSRGTRGSEYTIWQASRATSAASLYFPPVTLYGRCYFDGGMQSNNPILEVVREATQEYPNRKFDAIVSIGTGKSDPVDPDGGLTNLVLSLVSRVTDTELKHNDFLAYFSGLRDVYSRLQETERLGPIDLADWQKLDEIEQLANDYLNSPHGQDELTRCAKNLAWNNGD